jgi:signal transduction histidine kinase/HAMP domain-containing protein
VALFKTLMARYLLLSFINLSVLAFFVYLGLNFTRTIEAKTAEIYYVEKLKSRTFAMVWYAERMAKRGASPGLPADLIREIREFDAAVATLTSGDPRLNIKPMGHFQEALPQFSALVSQWRGELKPNLLEAAARHGNGYAGQTGTPTDTWNADSYLQFAGDLDRLITCINLPVKSDLREFERFMVIIVAIYLLASIFLAFYLRKNITSNILSLLRATHRIKKGDFGVTVAAAGHDEIGALSLSFNEMSRNLKSAFDENLLLLQNLQSVYESLDFLGKISSALNSSLSVEDIVARALDEVLNLDLLCRDKKGAFFLSDEENRVLHLAASRGLSGDFRRGESTVPFGDCLSGLAARSGADLISPDCSADARQKRQYPELSRHGQISLCLKASDKVLGVLCLYLPEGTTLGPEEKSLFQSISGIVSVSLENALNHRQVTLLALSLKASNDEIALSDQALRRSKASLVNAQRIARVGNWDWNLADHQLDWSEEVYRILGLVPGECSPSYRLFLHAVFPGDRGLVTTSVRGVLRDKKASQLDVRVGGAGGEQRSVHLQGEVTFDAGGRPVLIVGTLQDITEGKRAADGLRQNAETLLALAEATDLVMSTTSMASADTLYQTICSVAVAEFRLKLAWIGLVEADGCEVKPVAHAGDSDGYPWGVRVAWDESPSGMGPVGSSIRSKTPQIFAGVPQDPRYALWREVSTQNGFGSSMAVPLISSDNKVMGTISFHSASARYFTKEMAKVLQIYANQAAAALENAWLVQGLEAKVADRTRALEGTTHELQLSNHELFLRRDEAESALLQAEEANRAKSYFLANMSHELRTPLNAIMGFSQLMINGMTGILTEEQVDFLKDIDSSGKHLLTLINDILDLSKVEAGKMELDPTEFGIGDLIERCLVMFKENSVKQGVAVELDIDESLVRMVADETKLMQVMVNLLSNAFKYTPDRGRVCVTARRALPLEYGVYGDQRGKAPLFQPRYPELSYYLEVRVRDTGPGIRVVDIPKLFQPFQQIETTLAEKRPGTGLGLNLCKKYIELQGGRIWVETELGKGSTFAFVIPASPLLPGADRPEVRPRPSGSDTSFAEAGS